MSHSIQSDPISSIVINRSVLGKLYWIILWNVTQYGSEVISLYMRAAGMVHKRISHMLCIPLFRLVEFFFVFVFLFPFHTHSLSVSISCSASLAPFFFLFPMDCCIVSNIVMYSVSHITYASVQSIYMDWSSVLAIHMIAMRICLLFGLLSLIFLNQKMCL